MTFEVYYLLADKLNIDDNLSSLDGDFFCRNMPVLNQMDLEVW